MHISGRTDDSSGPADTAVYSAARCGLVDE